MDNKIQVKIVGLSTSQAQSGSFALVLGEAEGNRKLPIIIGMAEAQAIAIELEKIKPNRPLTHDLFKELMVNFNIFIKEVNIYNLKEGIFYSKIIFKSEMGEQVEIEARPSDAVALAIRVDAPIFVDSVIISEAGIIFSDEEEGPETDIHPQDEVSKNDDSISRFSNDELLKLLNEAIENEDYERAAMLRDELNKRN